MNSVIFTAIFMKGNNIDGMSKIIDPGNLTVDELYTVIEFLKKHKRDGQFFKFWSGWEDGVNLITSGDVVVMTGWEPIVLEARRRGVPDVRYAEPAEGYEGWSNNIVLHSGVLEEAAIDRGVEAACYRLVDWLLSGTYSCILGDLRGYLVPTGSCTSLLAEDGVFEYFGSGGIGVSVTEQTATELEARVREKLLNQKGGVYWQNARPDNYALYEQLWSELRLI